MNLSLNTKALAESLRLLEKIVPTKSPLPILSHVLIRTGDHEVWLSCTDTELSLTRTISAVVNEPGAMVLPVKPLLDIVNQITEPDVHLFFEKNGARIAAGQFKLRLQSMHVDNFPNLPTTDANGILLPGVALRSTIRKVRACIADVAKRYQIQGALLVLSKNVLMLVATDGRRLAIAWAACDIFEQPSVILPMKLLDVLVEDDAESYHFKTSFNQIFLESEHATLTATKIDVKFPDYRRTLSTVQKNTNTLTIPRELLNAAMKRVSLISGDSRVVNFSVADSTLQLQAKNMTLGEAHEHIKVVHTGDSASVHLQSTALIDFLDHATKPDIVMKLGDAQAHALLEDENFITIAMSVRA